jgi:hypothetical protein
MATTSLFGYLKTKFLRKNEATGSYAADGPRCCGECS